MIYITRVETYKTRVEACETEDYLVSFYVHYWEYTFSHNPAKKQVSVFYPYNPWAAANYQPNDDDSTLALADEIGYILARM